MERVFTLRVEGEEPGEAHEVVTRGEGCKIDLANVTRHSLAVVPSVLPSHTFSLLYIQALRAYLGEGLVTSLTCRK